MDIRKIKKLIELLEESGIAEIEIKEGEEGVRISRMPAPGSAPCAALAASALPCRPPPGAAAGRRGAAAPAESAAPSPKPNEHVITAPMVGTFYAAPSPAPRPSSRSAMRSSSARCCASSRR